MLHFLPLTKQSDLTAHLVTSSIAFSHITCTSCPLLRKMNVNIYSSMLTVKTADDDMTATNWSLRLCCESFLKSIESFEAQILDISASSNLFKSNDQTGNHSEVERFAAEDKL